MQIETTVRYPEISPRSYEHPADRAATSALHSIPLFDGLVRRFGHLGLETQYRQFLLGDSVQLGSTQVPDVWSMHVRAATRLDMSPTPLYVTQQPISNAMTYGMRSPVVVAFSPLVADYSPDEVESVLAHELAHVLSEHQVYLTAQVILAQLLRGVVPSIPLVGPLAGLPLAGLNYVLLEWRRAAEMTCDRAAALEIDDPMVVCRTLMRMAGGALPGMSVDAFITQSIEYTDEEDLFARGTRFAREISRTHPVAVRRVRELVTWVQSGDFDRIRSGSYVRRGEEAPPSAEAEAAVQHYRERFISMIDRTIGGINKLSNQMSAWLRRNDGGDGPEDHGEAP
jgi:Zn-dependent protease with chaperone function